MSRIARRTLVAGGLATLLAVVVAGIVAFQFAVAALQDKVRTALGERGEVQEIRVGFTGIEVVGVRIRAARGAADAWPAEDELRAQRIVLVPDLLDLLTAKVSIASIRVEDAYVSILRAKDGRISMLPSLLEKPAAAKAGKGAGTGDGAGETTAAPRAVSIGKTVLANATIEFFDATIRKSAFRISLERINATIGKLQLPGLEGVTSIKLDGVVKGVRQDGALSVAGTVELASWESGLATRLIGVDLLAFQPYLMKATETGITSGTLDLDLKSSVRKSQLRAPGTITLRDLQLAPAAGSSKASGISRDAAIEMMKRSDGRIPVKFVVEGDLSDPRFSLNEALLASFAASFARMRGVDVDALAREVAGIRSGKAANLGETLGKLFKKQP